MRNKVYGEEIIFKGNCEIRYIGVFLEPHRLYYCKIS